MVLIVKGREFMWPLTLRENTITVDDKEDYTASIKKYRSTKTFADVANEISIERTEYRPETVEHIEKLAEQKIVEMLLNGNMFAGEYFIYKPSISGVFNAKGEPREGVQLSINVSGTALLREALGEVKFEIVEKQELGGAVILQVKDLQSSKTDGSLIRGHAAEVSGRKVKCVQKDGVTLHEIRLVSDLEVPTVVTDVLYNEPSRVVFNVPNDLAEGKYRLEIETYFADGNKMLKAPRTLTYNVTLV